MKRVPHEKNKKITKKRRERERERERQRKSNYNPLMAFALK
jgi:hypothetical protein